MFGTHHHAAFDKWWEYAADNYVSWDEDKPVGIDLYYDPIVNEHVAHGTLGIIAPTWYFAPQRPSVALAGWQTLARDSGIASGGAIAGLNEPSKATTILQFAGEFADAETKARIWEQADRYIEPVWDKSTGEFTLGFGLNEAHPRGQMNARAMSGWVCTPGAWSKIFNQPNLKKFNEPTVEGVDFPQVAMSVAHWDGSTLHLAAQPQNDAVHGTTTTFRVTNLDVTKRWQMVSNSGSPILLEPEASHLKVSLVVDNQLAMITRVN